MVLVRVVGDLPVDPVDDPRIYAFEEVLGVKFSLWSAQAYGILTPLSAVATACYNLVAIAIAVVAAGQRERGREQEGAERGPHLRGLRIRPLFRVPGCRPRRLFGLTIQTRCRQCLSIPRC